MKQLWKVYLGTDSVLHYRIETCFMDGFFGNLIPFHTNSPPQNMIISFTLSFEIFIHKTNKCCDRINKKGDPTQFDISVLNLLLLVGHTLTAFIHFLRYSRRLAVSKLIETCYKIWNLLLCSKIRLK